LVTNNNANHNHKTTKLNLRQRNATVRGARFECAGVKLRCDVGRRWHIGLGLLELARHLCLRLLLGRTVVVVVVDSTTCRQLTFSGSHSNESPHSAAMARLPSAGRSRLHKYLKEYVSDNKEIESERKTTKHTRFQLIDHMPTLIWYTRNC
jgi:hypothetical protein